jgi:hypothetical protein
MDHYQAIVDAVNKFNRMRIANISHGACDSEIYYAFRNVIRQAIKGRDPYIPRSQSEWELYETVGADEAAEILYQTAAEVVNTIRTCPIRYIAQAKELVDSL